MDYDVLREERGGERKARRAQKENAPNNRSSWLFQGLFFAKALAADGTGPALRRRSKLKLIGLDGGGTFAGAGQFDMPPFA